MNTTLLNTLTKINQTTKLFLLGILLLLGLNAQAQVVPSPYQYFNSGLASQMGPDGWTLYGTGNWNSAATSFALAHSGNNYVTQTAKVAGSYFISPKINTPQTFSFWVNSSVAAVNYSIAFSDDNKTTWTAITNGITSLSTATHPTPFAVSSAFVPSATTTWQQVTVTAAFPANANGYYFRIFDTRATLVAGTLACDDFLWTSSVASDNTIVVPLLNNTTQAIISVPTTAVYHLYDVGGLYDFYSKGQTNNILFTPATGGDKIKITFVPVNYNLANNGKIFINDYTTTVGNVNPVTVGGVLSPQTSAATPNTTSYVSSLSSNGSIAIQFTSNGTYPNTGGTAPLDGFDIKVECSSSVCQLPLTTPTISAIGSTTATINWTGISPGYEYMATTSSTAPLTAGTYTTAVTGNVTGLTPNTYYYGWVRGSCGSGSYSAWVKSIGFMTQCPANSVPYGENFTGYSFALPTCTSEDINGDWQTYLPNNDLVTSLAGNFFYTQPVSLTSGTTYKLSYDYSAPLGFASFDVYYGTINDTTMQVPANLLASHVNVSALTSNALNFTIPTTGAYYIGFYLSATDTPFSLTTQLVLDTILVDCIAPPTITPSTTLICDTSTLVTLTGSGASGYTWTTSSGTLYSDSAGTIPYVALANVNPVYLRTNANTTVTVSGINGGCNKTATQAITIKSTTWNGKKWSLGAPDSGTQAVFAGNYTSTGDLNACSVVVNSGAVLIKAGNSLIAQNAVTVTGGSLTFENSASLVQVNNVTNGVGVYSGGNSGNITCLRDTNPMNRYDYTYWSSPVYPQTLLAVSPLTMSDKYYSYTASSNSWTSQASNSLMNAGQGYIIRAPQTFDPVLTQVYHASFVGVPNSGSITTPIAGPAHLNLIGNPYPCAISADAFMSYASNSGVIDATLYLWTHNTPLASNQYTANDYAVYNYLGGTGTSGAPGSNNSVPGGKIASGQSFFIKGLANGTATFQNSMRVVGNNSQFFKPSNASQGQNNTASRIWLDVTDGQGGYKQTLVGYAQHATNGIDRGYDGSYYDFGTSVSLYSLVGTTSLAIQGRSLPFTNSDEVPLGFTSATAGTFTINLYDYDGLFVNQNVYLKDLLLNTIVNLKNGAYSFASNSGTFNSRFVLVYKDRSRNNNTNDKIAQTQDAIILYKPDQELHVDAGTTVMSSIKVFDLRGRLIAQKTAINDTKTTLDITTTHQVVLLEITTVTGEVITKKYIN